MSVSVLIVPLAVDSSDPVDLAMSRQIPLAWEVAFEGNLPGVLHASCEVETVSGITRFVTRPYMSEETARVAAAQENCDGVVLGLLECRPGLTVRRVIMKGLDVSTGATLFEKTFSGEPASLVRQGIAAITECVGIDSSDAAEFFEPRTRSVEAYTEFLTGLDLLLRAKRGIDAPDSEEVIVPFDRALDLDNSYRAALATGIYSAMLAVKDSSEPELLVPVGRILSKWCTRYPENANLHATTAETLIRAGDAQGAEVLLRGSLELSQSPDRNLLKMYADVCAFLGKLDESFAAYKKCEEIEHDPGIAESLAGLAVILGHLDDAREYSNAVLNDDPNQPLFHGYLAMDAFRRGDMAESFHRFGEALSTDKGPGRAVLDDLTCVLEATAPPGEFREFLRGWYPPPGVSAGERILLGRALRLIGAPLEAKLCLRTIADSDLDECSREMLGAERIALGVDSD